MDIAIILLEIYLRLNKTYDVNVLFYFSSRSIIIYWTMCTFLGSSAVMQTDGFEYLKESCPPVLTELLEYVARFTEHSDFMCKHRNEAILDGSDINGRRVKQRL